MRKKITVITAFMLMFTLVIGTGTVYGASLSDIKKDIQNKQKQLEDGKSQEKALSQEIQDLEVEINSAENQLESLRSKIAETEDKVVAAEADLKKAEEDVETQNANLNVRLRTCLLYTSARKQRDILSVCRC